MKHVVFHLVVFYLLRKGVRVLRVSTFWFPGILFFTKLLVPAIYFLLSVAKMCSVFLRTEECFQYCLMSRSVFSPFGFLCLEKLPLLFFFFFPETAARGVGDSIMPSKSQFEDSRDYLQFICRTRWLHIVGSPPSLRPQQAMEGRCTCEDEFVQ